MRTIDDEHGVRSRGGRTAAWLSALLLLGMSTAAVGELYRWVDSEGRVHFGDAVPPAAAGHDRDRVDTRTGRVTPGQRRGSDGDVDEAGAAERQLEEARAAEQARKDRVLLMTFTTERDLALAREERLSIYDTTIRMLESKCERLKSRLFELDDRIKALQESGREVPEGVAQEFRRVGRQLLEAEGIAAQKREERRLAAERLDADLARYRELKQGRERPRPQTP